MLPRDDAITFVRNHLIEHPEGNGGPYARYLTVIDDGSILKTVKRWSIPRAERRSPIPRARTRACL
jgi:hypothetical protein